MIRILAGAGVAAMLMASATMAHATEAGVSRCGEVPPAPTAPDGATANQQEVREAVAAYDVWRQAVEANLACRHTEASELQAAAAARVNEYNAALNRAREVGAAFQASTEAYNARAPRQRQIGRR